MRVDIRGPRVDRARTAERLFAHIAGKTTDLADSVMEIDSAEFLDEELARRERRQIFGRVPVIAAHGTELADPGDFLVTQLPNNEALLVRQADGSVRAFVNTCRHRGARLVTEGSGSARLFSCTYHGWGYRPDGVLRVIPAPGTFGDLDKGCFGLVGLPCEERHGFVWVVDSAGPDPGGPGDVADWLGPEMDDTLTAYGLDRYLCYRVGGFDEPINWKVLTDAFLDNYHIATTHAKTVAPYFYSNTQVVDRIGRHTRAISPRRSIDGILAEPPESAPVDLHVTIGYSLLPNTVLLRQPDHFQLLTFLPHPDGAGRSRMEIRLLIPEPAETQRQVALWDKNWTILMNVLRDEDMELNRDLQLALRNADCPRTLLVGRNEVVNQWFHTWLAGALADPPNWG